ncbi:hypothetical protein B1J92_I04466g [Nakaseomyces glabratus]|nr:hypothetical protein B1J91_I04466g [Nakaseomyces glabratus]OXB49349.1 hypothetical protein B1J92_I04466g [Nakaseomyces glabratus]
MEYAKPRSFAASSGKQLPLLHDPELVDDYKDILKLKPYAREEDSGSNMGSVVVTPTERTAEMPAAAESPAVAAPAVEAPAVDAPAVDAPAAEVEEVEELEEVKDTDIAQEGLESIRASMISGTSSRYSVGSEMPARYLRQSSEEPLDGLTDPASNSHDDDIHGHGHDYEGAHGGTYDDENDNTYNYSDSDFEDNLEQRMKEIDHEDETDADGAGSPTAPATSRFSHNSDDDEDAENKIDGLHFESSDDSSSDDNLLYADEDFEEEEDYTPLPPPKELDPDKLYALYPFQGPDSSHCQLEQDEPCILLNDQDAYWWLVKRCSDKKIGFAPAEILETFPERLARLNCWKNENMSTHSFINSDGTIERRYDVIDDETDENLENRDSGLKNYAKGNKSVSFNNVVEYAERILDDVFSESDEESNGVKHHDEFSEGKLGHNALYTNDDIIDDDDVSEVVSDVSFGQNNMAPLNIKKVRKHTEDQTLEKTTDSGDAHLENSSISNAMMRKDGLGKGDSDKDFEEHVSTKSDNVPKLSEMDRDGTGEDFKDSKFQLPHTEISNNNKKHKELDNKLDAKSPSIRVDDVSEAIESVVEEDHIDDDSEEDEVMKVFEAPMAPFAGNSSSQMPNSNSDYSISTIGEYSPSSAENVIDSPNPQSFEDQTLIPSSKAVRDITHLMKKEDDEDNEHIHIDHTEEDNRELLSVSSSDAENEFATDVTTHCLGSSASVSSAFSKNLPSRSGSSITSESGKHHPMVEKLYGSMFERMDSLFQKLDEVVQ